MLNSQYPICVYHAPLAVDPFLTSDMSMDSKRTSISAKPLQTCDVCKLRHQKCSGERPRCSHCELRNLQCVYSNVPAHKVDRSVIRRSSSIRPGRNATRRVFNSPPASVREAAVASDSSSTGREDTPSQGTPDVHKNQLPAKTQAPRSAATASLQYFVGAIRLILLGDDGEDTSRPQSSAKMDGPYPSSVWKGPDVQPSKLIERDELPPKEYSQALLNAFLDGPNKFIYVCDPIESQRQLDLLYDFNIPIREDLLALIYLQLSLGAQFTDDMTELTCSAWYESGRSKMEVALERDQECWLWVAQAMLLTCLYSVVAKPSMCWIALGMSNRLKKGPLDAEAPNL